MPAKQRLGPHAERRPPLRRHKPAQRGEPGPIGLLEARSRLVAAQDLELMAQHQDLDLLRLAAPEDQHHEREHAMDSEIRERPQLGTERNGLGHDEGAPYSDPSRARTARSAACSCFRTLRALSP